MRCDQARQQLAIYRELTSDEREAVDRHLASCPECVAVFEQYRAQDEALSVLLGADEIEPSREWMNGVLDRTVRRAGAGRRRGWGPRAIGLARTLAVAVLAFVVLAAGAVGVSAQALPGSGLYPVKRAVEQVRLNLTLDEAKRAAYRQTLADLRRYEVARVVAQQLADGSAGADMPEVAFQGSLVQGDEGGWVVGGIAVTLDPAVAPLVAASAGEEVAVEAVVQGGQVVVSRVDLLPTPTPFGRRDAPVGAPAQPERSDVPTAVPSVAATAETRPSPATPTSRPTGMSPTPTPGGTGARPLLATVEAIKTGAAEQVEARATERALQEATPRFTPTGGRPTATPLHPDRLATLAARATAWEAATRQAHETAQALATAAASRRPPRVTPSAYPLPDKRATALPPPPTLVPESTPIEAPTPRAPTRWPTRLPTRRPTSEPAWRTTPIPAPTRRAPTGVPEATAESIRTAAPAATAEPAATANTGATPVPPPTAEPPPTARAQPSAEAAATAVSRPTAVPTQEPARPTPHRTARPATPLPQRPTAIAPGPVAPTPKGN